MKPQPKRNIKPQINPRWFQIDHREVVFPQMKVFYLAALKLDGVKYFLHGKFNTGKRARKYALAVKERWIRLYDAALLAQSTPEPTAEPESVPVEA